MYKSDHQAMINSSVTNIPGSHDDDNSQDDGYLMGLFEPQHSATETTLEKL